MIVVDVDTASLARLRLTPSPAQELLTWLRLVANGRRHPVYGDAGAAARSALLDHDVALAAALLPPDGYVPDLLTPKPLNSSTRALDDQLDVVAEAPDDAVQFQVAVHRPSTSVLPPDVRRAVEKGNLARRTARGMRVFWEHGLRAGWTQLRSVLEADIETRARELARNGMAGLLASLHPTMRWDGSRIEILKPYDERTRLDDAELVLAPSAMGWPSLAVQVNDPADAVISYPANGIGLRRRNGEARSSLGDLVGSSRELLLGQLAIPRSTSELSASTGLAPATVSHHLSVLLRADLVVRQREGRCVLYRRNARGEALVAE